MVVKVVKVVKVVRKEVSRPPLRRPQNKAGPGE